MKIFMLFHNHTLFFQSIGVLKALYTDYKDVDLTVGGALEALAPGAQVGPTFLCILNEQFARSRRADRFWFENEASGLTEGTQTY